MLDAHGWGEVGDRLHQLAASGDWAGMAGEISDEMLDAYAISGTPDTVPAQIKARYAGLLDRITFYFADPPGKNQERWAHIVGALKS